MYHILKALLCHTGIETQPEGVAHDAIGDRQFANNAVVDTFAILLKGGMTQQVTSKEITRLNLMVLKIARQFVTGVAGILLHGDEEAKPAGTAVFLRFRQQQPPRILQSAVHDVEILATALNDEVELLELRTADGGLHVGGFQVVA